MKAFLLYIVTVVMAMVLQVVAATEETYLQQLQQQLRDGARNLNLEHGICHAVGGTDKEEYSLLSGIPSMALKNHMEQHGDGVPGGKVPDRPGCTFTATCEIVCVPVCPCWPEGKPEIAIGDATQYVSALEDPPRGEAEYELRTESNTLMRASLWEDRTTCDSDQNSLITTLEEHEACVRDILDASIDNHDSDVLSFPPICQPWLNVSAVPCPCWENFDALLEPGNATFLYDDYIQFEGSFGFVDVANGPSLTVHDRRCIGPDGPHTRISREEEEVCYNQLVEYARHYNSTNRCFDPWRDD